MMTRFDFGVLIPLAEEFTVFAEHVETLAPLKGDWAAVYYDVTMAGHRVVARQMSTMGTDAAAVDVTQMTRDFGVPLIFVLGLGGSLDRDVLVGDVVAASQIDDYLHMSKATSKQGAKTYELSLAGEVFPGHFALREAVSNFPTLNPAKFKEWQLLAEGFLHPRVDLDSLPQRVRSLVRCPPRLHVGHMASGPTVGASVAFREFLRQRDRKYLAIEMEGAGAARALDRLSRGRIAVIRGISDLAGPEKRRLDAGTRAEAQGVWREYALHNLFSFFGALVADNWFAAQLRAEDPRAAEQTETGALRQPAVGVERSGQLPRPRTRFFGRESDLRNVQELLSESQLVTITGPPGVGKSRLAVESGRALATQFSGGVFLVELDQITEPGLVLSRVAEAAGLRELPGISLVETLQRAFARRRVLLILDNCEHVLDAGPDVAQLLERSPDLAILATSFATIKVAGERRYSLEPLPVPKRGEAEAEVDVRALAMKPAAALFIDRAAAVESSFRLTSTNADAVVKLCERFDGLPLALELAAPWMRVLSVQEYLARSDEVSELPHVGPQAPGHRHRSLQDAFFSSYTLLKPAEQALFRRLGVFQGGADLAAVEAVDLSVQPTLVTVAALLDMSLIERADDDAARPRYTERPPLQRFALAELASLGEEDATRNAHARCFEQLAHTASQLLRGQEQMLWLTQLEMEHGNLRAALDRLETSGELVDATRMANALTRFWYVRGHLGEGRRRLERLLLSSSCQAEPWTSARVGAGLLAREQGDYQTARSHLRTAVRLYRESGDDLNMAVALYHLGILEGRDQRQGPARTRFRESLRAARRVSDAWTIASAWRGLSHVAAAAGEYPEASRALERSLEHFRTAEDPRGLAISLRFSGEIAIDLEDRKLARLRLRECLRILSQLDDAWSVNNALLAMARLAAAEGLVARAVRLEAAAAALRSGIGAVLPAGDQARVDSWLQPARETLSARERRACLEEGAAMSLREVIAYALDEDSAADHPMGRQSRRRPRPPS